MCFMFSCLFSRNLAGIDKRSVQLRFWNTDTFDSLSDGAVTPRTASPTPGTLLQLLAEIKAIGSPLIDNGGDWRLGSR